MVTPPPPAGEPAGPDPGYGPSADAPISAAPQGHSNGLVITTIVLAFVGGVLQVIPGLLALVGMVILGGAALSVAPEAGGGSLMLTFLAAVAVLVQLVAIGGGLLLIFGATGVICRRHYGRRAIVVGSLVLLALQVIGWLTTLVMLATVRTGFRAAAEGIVGAGSADDMDLGSVWTDMASLVNVLTVVQVLFPLTLAALAIQPAVRAYCHDTSPLTLSRIGPDFAAAVGTVIGAARTGTGLRDTSSPARPPIVSATEHPSVPTPPVHPPAAPTAPAPHDPPSDTAPQQGGYTAATVEQRPSAAVAAPAQAPTPGPTPIPAPAPTPSADGWSDSVPRLTPRLPSLIPRGAPAHDLAAILLVLGALALPWNYGTQPILGEGAPAHIAAIIVTTVVLILAVSMPYLRRAFAVGTAAEPPVDKLLRRVAAAA